MIPSSIPIRGTIRGKTIELQDEPGLPDGQTVAIFIEAVADDPSPPSISTPESEAQRRWREAKNQVASLQPGEGLKLSFGAWAEDANALDEYLATNRERRKLGRPGIKP